MAIINQGILGAVSGKVGQVIGASWRGISYVRIYAVPSNPQTVAQQTQRSKFSACVKAAKFVLSTVIHKFWENVYPSMSGFNAFVKANIATASDTGELVGTEIFSLGSLEATTITTKTYDALTGVAAIGWDKNCLGNGTPTDKACILVYDKANDYMYIVDAMETRNSDHSNVVIPTGLDPTKIFAYLFFYRGTAPNYLCSPTIQTGALVAA